MSVFRGRVDFARLLLALLIALGLYGAVRAEQNPPETGTFDVPVDITNVPQGLLLVSGEASTVTVRVSAPREEWVSLRPGSFRATVQLTRGSTGVDEYPVSITVPDPRVKVIEIIPPRLPVRLDENIDRSVPVKVTRLGNVPFGYEAGDSDIEPATVTVGGPASLVRRVEAVSVEIRLDAATVDVDASYTVTPVDTQGQAVPMDNRTIRVTPAQVRVKVPITQQLSYKTVGVQPDINGTPQSGFVIGGITTEPSTVTIVGAPRALAAVNTASTERLELNNATASVTRQLAVSVPDGISVVQQDTVRVSVQITGVVLSQSFTTVPLPDNLRSDLQIVSAIPSVQVVLSGVSSALADLRQSDLRATMNLAGLGPGPQQTTVEVNAPPGVSVQAINPRVVLVTLNSVNPPTPTPEPTTAPTAAPVTSTAPASPVATPGG